MKYVRASAGRVGIEIVFENVNQPRHDGRTIYLPRITSKTTDDELKQLMCSVDHEVAHDRFSSFDVLKEKGLDANGILMFVWNLLEDSRVNVIEAKEYKGFRENWDECSCSLVENILTKASKEASAITNIVSAMLKWESQISAPFFPGIEATTAKFSPDEKVLDVLSNYSDRLGHCHNILDKRLGTEATYQLAYDILSEFGKKCKKEIIGEEKPTTTTTDKDKGGKKTTAKAGKDKSTGSSSSSSKEEDSVGKEAGEDADDEDEYKVIEVKLTSKDLEELSLTMPEDGKEMGKVGINFKPVSSSGTWDLTDYDKFTVVNYPKNIGSSHMLTANIYTIRFTDAYNREVGSKLVSQENFAQQVRRLIQIRAKVQTQYGVKKGKLDQSRLSRICFNAPGFNERIFKNKIENKTLDAAITVLVDMSGSMGGHKAYFALASTLLMNEVCSTLNIPVEILGFTDGYAGACGEIAPTMFVYKNFSDLRISNDDLTRYFATSSSFMAGNPDGENILWAHDRLIKRKEKKKILVVMSDGSPAASKSSIGLGEFTKKVISEIEASKKVDIYGLGLCADDVEYYYKSHSVVTKPEQIPTKLIELIERKIINV